MCRVLWWSKKNVWLNPQHCTLEICPISPMKSRFGSCSIEQAIFGGWLWAWTDSRELHAGFALSSMLKFWLNHCFLKNLRYYTRTDAENALRYINGTRLDDRVIRCDWDAGFKEGRQYGRGKHGGQVKNFKKYTTKIHSITQGSRWVSTEFWCRPWWME